MVTVRRKVFNKPCEASQRDFYVIIIAVTHQFPFATVESKLSGVRTFRSIEMTEEAFAASASKMNREGILILDRN